MAIAFVLLRRGYVDTSEWDLYIYGAFALWLSIMAIGGIIGWWRDRKDAEHAALNRVRERMQRAHRDHG